MKIENLDDLAQCFSRFAALKDKFKQAHLLDDFEEALELHSFLREVARKASKISIPTDQETHEVDTASKNSMLAETPKRTYKGSKRAEIEHTKRLEKIKALELKEQEGTLNDNEKRSLKSARKAEREWEGKNNTLDDPLQ
ncbi:hypothetical protein NHP21005_09200 [Helicobacter sp. NHP21005]|uniref:hypothetical protein n=1 Tax=Helicobacter felistomachi TaxID=3040201 RepID=UPI002574181A|nr:hypothetical protein [Helicobacter sp. NHP21005]BEG57232.1 hypothetical protein NHP21005_09200 [Helicobacter sp. NHP21005]